MKCGVIGAPFVLSFAKETGQVVDYILLTSNFSQSRIECNVGKSPGLMLFE
jgi:hypothetical protein